MDYDLSRLSTRSFEQLIQALAAAVIGPDIVVFGDGPNGGREATFEGPMSFPNSIEPWNGYLVVQAKFRQRGEGKEKDGAWALQALREDLEKFTDTERGLRKPEYYLFATNVVLTAVAEQGGKDRTIALLEEYKPKLGLEGFQLWDYDQIRTLLDQHGGIRKAYLAWITPGDVLAEILEQIKPERADFRRVMSLLLQKDLLADQYVRLGQAGYSAEDHTPLAKVFVDLPVGNQNIFAELSAATNIPEGQERPGGIDELLLLGAQRLDPQSNPPANRPAPGAQAESQSRATRTPGRVVLVGGPGQGKTTLTQFLCQLHRVAMLDNDPNNNPSTHLSPEVQDACHLIRRQCEPESLSLPSMARFPLRVELNQFAAALADEKVNSLFDYLLRHIQQRTNDEITSIDLRAWLGHYPWLIVLDGLDEVPVSSNRDQVLEAIQEFLIEAHACNADLLLVATTRPQGYNDDFSPRYYRHRYLLPLDVPQALHYGERLAAQRWANAPDKRQQIEGRLKRAGQEETTARLMRSPLQVTIMALLVETVGQPPQERWRLFNEYYQVIFRREKARDIPAADLLNRHGPDIDAIHQQVGRRLQTHSEQSGGTEAIMGEAEFRKLVEERLIERGHQGEGLARLTKSITDATLQRLVFLVAPREGRIGFEIRSLQEFMAAQWLMNSSDEAIRLRLRAIAPAAHWRNVFLFATGRCFHDNAKEHLQDNVHTICYEYNEATAQDDELEQAVLLGSRLALEILEDGALGYQPRQLRSYARLALRLLELPPAEEHSRLARQYRPELEAVFREELGRHLEDSIPERRLSTWRTLVELIGREVPWAREVADAHWPKEAASRIEILKATTKVDKPSDWLAECWAQVILWIKPGAVEDFWSKINWWLSEFETRSAIEYASKRLSHHVPKLTAAINHIKGVDFLLVPLDDEEPSQKYDPPILEGRWEWRWLLKTEAFRHRPAKEDLADLLTDFAKHAHDIARQFGGARWNIAWPLLACIQAAHQSDDLNRIAQAAKQGKLGDGADWLAAQRRWRKSGITEQDLQHVPKEGLPFDNRIGDRGFPFHGYYYRIRIPTIENISQLYAIWITLGPSSTRKRIANIILFLLESYDKTWENISSVEFLRLVRDAESKWVGLGLLESLPEGLWNEEDGRKAIDMLGKRREISYFHRQITETGLRLERLIRERPESYGILRLLAAACIVGYQPTTKEFVPIPTDCEEPRYRGAALVVQIAQGILESRKPAEIAKEFVKLSAKSSEDLVDDALSVIRKQELSGPRVAQFLVALFSALPVCHWQTRGSILRAMQSQQRRHLSRAEDLQS
uniref:NACHT domain-containing protein n=1 Tax=Candidatus Kentrum sp. TUN TaxID=2126343 RepID=A0A450ZPX4_9GAMM|nr:MAG: hypothetical protein BECKTUN1418E_GA0071001_10053 [Candidatus Kentron sp. TUN]VFK55827.1 MAG: hypothetical protein BECKTUN1418F_GA0071002_10753 [Candidatus Kentron sp. TUN]